MLRLTSIVLIPLSLYVLVTFFNSVIFGGYKGALHWAHEPPTGVFLILFLAAAFHHAASGLQEAIEDYIHCEYAKLATLLVVRFIAAVFALFGIIAVFTIQFQELIPHASGLPIY
jgi:succinate dehydrogenase / fumarate reductase membrane anchor subunit